MPKVLMIATGGTIAMKKDSNGRPVPVIGGEELLSTIGEERDALQWSVLNFSNIASCNMSPARMRDLSAAINQAFADPDLHGAVVTHGTDTLAETAYFLDLTLHESRPLVLTAAQRDISDADSDGPRNLKQALLVALNKEARNRGVLICCNEKIFGAREVRKVHTSNVDAFQGGTLGFVDGASVVWSGRAAASVKLALPESVARVPVFKMYTGAEESDFQFLEHWQMAAVVLEAFGRGNIPSNVLPVFERIMAKGIPVVITSRCPDGSAAPVYGYPGGGADLAHRGFWFGRDLSAEKARILMSVALGAGCSHDEVREMLASGGRRKR